MALVTVYSHVTVYLKIPLYIKLKGYTQGTTTQTQLVNTTEQVKH